MTSPLQWIANASADSLDNGLHNIYNKINALGRTLKHLETSVRGKTTLSDTLMRQALLTIDKTAAKIETSNFNKLSLETKKNPVKNITGKSFNSLTYNICDWLSYEMCRFIKAHGGDATV